MNAETQRLAGLAGVFQQPVNGDSCHFVSSLRGSSVDLIVTSPPFGLVREKDYGNVPADDYLDWFRPYATQFYRILKRSGSLVIDIGGVWNKGEPTRHLYHFELLVMLCKEYGRSGRPNVDSLLR